VIEQIDVYESVLYNIPSTNPTALTNTIKL